MKNVTVLLLFICLIFENIYSQFTEVPQIKGVVKEIQRHTLENYYSYAVLSMGTSPYIYTYIGKQYTALQDHRSRIYVEWDLSSLVNKIIKNAKIELFYYRNADIRSTDGGIFSIFKTENKINSFNADQVTWDALSNNAEKIYEITIAADEDPRWIIILNATKVKKTSSPETYYTFAEYLMKLINSGVRTLHVSMINNNESSNGLIFNCEDYEYPFKITYELSVPSQPTNLSISNLTTTGFILNWAPSSGAAGYYVSLDNGNDVYTTSTSFQFLNLNPNTTHTVYVSAVNGNEISAQSSLLVTILPLVQPNNFSMSNVTCSGCKLSWDQVDGVSGYKVYCNGSIYNSVTTNNITISGLGYGIYNFTVCSYNEKGDESSQTNALTLNITTPSSPYIELSREEDRLIFWNQVNYATSYKFYVYKSVPALKLLDVIPTTNTYFYFDPNYVGSYVFKVTANNGSCESNFSNSIAINLLDYERRIFIGSEKNELDKTLQNKDITVSPNPATDILTINGINSTFNYIIYDLIGKKLIEIQNSNEKIDISTLQSGIYTINIESEGKIYKLKFFKQ